MSDYRDTIKNAIKNGIILDSCGYDERQKVWGRYIDLCGMKVEDAIPLGPEDCGGGGDKSGKTKNTVTFLMVENGQGNYTLNLSAEHASTNEFKASFVMDGATKLVTVPAGATMYDTELTGYDPQKPYSIISDITILSESTTYNYVSKNTVKTGVFVLTINNDGTVSKENVKYGTVYELPTVVEKPGYDYVWKDESGEVITGNTITMPEKDTTVNGTYVIKNYTLSYNIVEFNYENNSVVSSVTTDDLTLPYGTNILNSVSGITPEKEGHTKSGWKYENGTNVLSGDTLLEDTQIKFVYTLNQYNLTYLSDGETFASETYYFGQEIVPLGNEPEKEGYTFVGWDNVPETMPANNVVINAVYNINSYNVTYYAEGIQYSALTLDYGAQIPNIQGPDKEGYTFSGWSGYTQTMPAHDVVLTAIYTINQYEISYVDEGVTLSSLTLDYGAQIPEIQGPDKEGYTFSGWSGYTETVPAHDVVLTAIYNVNQYEVSYVADGIEYSALTLDYGAQIPVIPAPDKEGYTFSGLSGYTETVPAHDVVLTAIYTINQYEVSYVDDGVVLSAITLDYGAQIPNIEAPDKEGYTFSGWSGYMETVPAHDVVLTAIYNVNQYEAAYFADGIQVSSITLDYGAQIPNIEAPDKEGYTFSGWSGYTETMPAHDVTLTAVYTINSYNAEYIIDGLHYSSATYQYGEIIVYPEIDPESGCTFAWDQKYITMPANDIVINGANTPILDVNTIYYDTILTSTENTISGVTGMDSSECEPSVKKVIPFVIPASAEYAVIEKEYNNGEIDDEEFDAWCFAHNYSLYVAAPSTMSFFISNPGGIKVAENEDIAVGQPFIVNGIEYQGYAYRTNTNCIASEQPNPYSVTNEAPASE